MEFNNILVDNIETPINITFSTPSQIFSNTTEKHSSKNGEHDDSHILKIEKYIKDKYDEVALDHLRQKNRKKSPLNSLRYQKHHQTILDYL